MWTERGVSNECVSFSFVKVAWLVRQFQIYEGNDWAVVMSLCLFVRSVMAGRQWTFL
jgi:hypothetical protein